VFLISRVSLNVIGQNGLLGVKSIFITSGSYLFLCFRHLQSSVDVVFRCVNKCAHLNKDYSDVSDHQ